MGIARMIEATPHPRKLADALANAAAISKDSEFVGVNVAEAGAGSCVRAYGRGRFVMGSGYAYAGDREGQEFEFDPATEVAIEPGEAGALQTALRKLSSARDAKVLVQVDGESLVVMDGGTEVCNLATIALDWDERCDIDRECSLAMHPDWELGRDGSPLVLHADVLTTLGKLRPTSTATAQVLIAIAFPLAGNTAHVQIGQSFYGLFEAINTERITDPHWKEALTWANA
ncbi:hypothetical protein [Brevibacterium album]|uniref:hypothetical protein n=1 Tax=Brevibacterium album TaxID=417948 RepID=UPI00048F799F|nr:hypothetical protein [Brevibacterium album]